MRFGGSQGQSSVVAVQLTAPQIETAWRRMRAASNANQPTYDIEYGNIGARLARARHPLLLRTLEAAAEELDAEEERQRGRTKRSQATDFSEQPDTVPTTMLREAMIFADQGNVEGISVFRWIYGLAADLSGLMADIRRG